MEPHPGDTVVLSQLGVTIAVVAGLAAGLSLFFAWRWRDPMAATFGQAESIAREIFDTLPGGVLTLEPNGRDVPDPGLIANFGDIRTLTDLSALLSVEDERHLLQAAEALRGRGEPFALTLPAADGACVLQFDGARGARSDHVWVRDATETVERATARLPRLEALTAERDALTTLMNALPLPVWRRDASGALTYVNRAYARVVERAPDVVVAEGRELVPPEATAAPSGAGAHAVGEAQPAHRTVVVAGERRRFALTEIADGAGTLGWALDETDATEAASELARHAAAHADVLENLGVAISIYGPDTRLRFANLAYAKLWGLEPDWLAAGPTRAEELDRLRERRRLPEAADHKRAAQAELALFTSVNAAQVSQLHLPDGTALNRRVAPHPLGGLLFAYENVTDILALERRYNTLIAVQRRTLDHLYEGVPLIGPDGRLQLCNPAYARLWQLDAKTLADEPHIAAVIERCRKLFRPRGEWPAHKERIIARLTGGEARKGRLARSDGSVLAYTVEPLPDGSVFLSYADITDRDQVESALRERAEALEAADRLKAEFIASVSRELRDPLTAINGFSQMLRLDMFGKLNAKQRDYVDSILQAGAALLKLIDDILDLATIEAGHMELTPARFDVHALMSEVFTLTRDRARQRHLKLRFDCPPCIGMMVADERRLKQVLFKLVSNALQFTPEGGDILLAAARDGSKMAFSVTDTGSGIPEEDREGAFDVFMSGGTRSIRQPGAGAGLGLSLVRRFVDLHGGTVELEPGSGRGENPGTRVVFRIPVDAAAAPPNLTP